MAQTGYTPILIYSSTTASQAPSASNLTNSTLGSELAINITDGKLFYKDNANAVQVIGWKTVPTTAGGTGLTSYTAGDLLYYATGTTLTRLAIGTAYYMLGVNAGGTAPSWQPSSTSTLTAQGDLLYASAANTLARLAKNTTASRYLSNGGTSNNPAWSQVDLSNGVTGTLPIANGGTNSTGTPTAGGVAYGTGTAYAVTAAGTSGYLLTSGGAGAPTWTNSTNANTASAVVQRDASGNFSAGTVTANINASTGYITTLTGNMSGNNTYQITGLTKLQLNDSSAYLIDGGFYGYVTTGLRSVFYGRGVYQEGGYLFNPTNDNVCTLGDGTHRWSVVYAANGTIQTSDQAAKTEITDTPLGLDFVKALTPRRYKMLESGSLTDGEEETYTDEEGNVCKRIKQDSQQPIPGKRFHDGLIAQEVKTVLDAHGGDAAMWVQTKDGMQGLRYEELIAPMIKAIQELSIQFEAYKAAHP